MRSKRIGRKETKIDKKIIGKNRYFLVK